MIKLAKISRSEQVLSMIPQLFMELFPIAIAIDHHSSPWSILLQLSIATIIPALGQRTDGGRCPGLLVGWELVANDQWLTTTNQPKYSLSTMVDHCYNQYMVNQLPTQPNGKSD